MFNIGGNRLIIPYTQYINLYTLTYIVAKCCEHVNSFTALKYKNTGEQSPLIPQPRSVVSVLPKTSTLWMGFHQTQRCCCVLVEVHITSPSFFNSLQYLLAWKIPEVFRITSENDFSGGTYHVQGLFKGWFLKQIEFWMVQALHFEDPEIPTERQLYGTHLTGERWALWLWTDRGRL